MNDLSSSCARFHKEDRLYPPLFYAPWLSFIVGKSEDCIDDLFKVVSFYS